MPEVDPEEVEAFALRVSARHDVLDPYRDVLTGEAQVETGPFGGDDAPWAKPLAETWNGALEAHVGNCDGAGVEIDKIHLNLLHVAAVWFEADGRAENDFNDTGASLEEHANGTFFEDW